MNIAACRYIADQATNEAYWTAVPESLLLGFLMGVFVCLLVRHV